MKKYKLKKDLPRAKAGTYVVLRENEKKSEGIYLINEYSEEFKNMNYCGKRLGFIAREDLQEWIEYRKPNNFSEIEIGDTFYFIHNELGVKEDIWRNFDWQKLKALAGIAFLSEKQAEQKLRALKNKYLEKFGNV